MVTIDTQQHVASHPPQLSVVDVSIAGHSDDVIGDITAPSQHDNHDDNFDVPSIDAVLEDSVYHDCIGASFTGKLL